MTTVSWAMLHIDYPIFKISIIFNVYFLHNFKPRLNDSIKFEHNANKLTALLKHIITTQYLIEILTLRKLEITQFLRRLERSPSLRFLRRLKSICSKRVNVRVNNSLCSSRLKRELYEYSDRESTIHYPRERTEGLSLSLLNLISFYVWTISSPNPYPPNHITIIMAFARPIPNEPWKHGSQRFMDMAVELDAKGLDYHIIKQMAGDTISIQEKMM